MKPLFPERKMIKARTGLILDALFFRNLVLKLKIIPDPSRSTVCTNGVDIRYNPDWIETFFDLN